MSGGETSNEKNKENKVSKQNTKIFSDNNGKEQIKTFEKEDSKKYIKKHGEKEKKEKSDNIFCNNEKMSNQMIHLITKFLQLKKQYSMNQ